MSSDLYKESSVGDIIVGGEQIEMMATVSGKDFF
jgi:hypothetical protein